MHRLVVLCCLVCLLGSIAGSISAAEPDYTVGEPNPGGPRFECEGGQCQYGFHDDLPGIGMTLGMGQQLGIVCSPAMITGVGFWAEFVMTPGPVSVWVNDVKMAQFPTVTPGENYIEFWQPFDSCGQDACIMLCPVYDTWLVTGEDLNSPPYGRCYWSNDCACSNDVNDLNLTIWACYEPCNPSPVENLTWGRIRMLYR